MTTPKLIIRKRMQLIQGKVRACCYVKAVVDPETKAQLDEHFLPEMLFKRSSYSVTWPEGTLAVPAALAPSLSALLKNDACPEITVKTLLAGQLHQGANVWEMMCFEFIAKVAFENFVAMTKAVRSMKHDVVYVSQQSADDSLDLESFDADTAAEIAALEGAGLAA